MSRHFMILAWDRPNSADARATARDAHFAHIETIIDRIAVAGPLKGPTGSNIGSLFVLDVGSAHEAEDVLRSDPYFRADIWEKWEIHPFLPAAGEWVGGKIW